MRAMQIIEWGQPLEAREYPDPEPQGEEVLLRVEAAGVCHSDLHIWEGGYDLGHGRKPLSLKERGVSLPRTMGHETVGEVLAFGPDEIQFGKTQINGDSARFLLGQSVRISSGQRFYQRAFAVIDVARCGNDEIPSGHFAHAALIARMTTSSCCGKIVRRSSLNRLSAM